MSQRRNHVSREKKPTGIGGDMVMDERIPRKLPKITIDQEKCTVPFLCKKCIQICPEAVFFVTRVMEKERRLEELDPRVDGNYVLSAARADKCTMCNLCIDVCPVDALSIKM